MPPLKALVSRDLYTIGWIAALPLEPSLAAGKYGTTSALATALPMLASVPQIRIGLLVGIGAGISRPDTGRDIRLGDVIVSQPQGNSGGVIQYDLFKAKPGKQWEGVAFLNSPPEVLLHALANIQAEHELEPPKALEYLEEAISRYPRLAKQGYVHQASPVNQKNPEIYYSTIASGNTLLRDATYRNKVLEDIGDKCICFEMEATGLINNFLYIVIRGICDYTDLYKSDRWQRYAVVTAAAYAKELLDFVPSQDLEKTRKAADILEDISENIADICSITTDSRTVIKKWLCPPDPSTNLNEAQKKRYEGTEYKYLWLHGIPWCGKTLLDKLVRSLIAQLISRCKNSRNRLKRLFFILRGWSPKEDIESEITQWLYPGNMVSIQQGPVDHDIRLYSWHSKPSDRDKIKTKLMKKANGMFRWAACQLDILQDCLNLDMLRESLSSLPRTLEETYARILGSIKRPLTIQEAINAIIVNPLRNPPFDPNLWLPEPREILKICSSLVSLVTRQVSSNTGETLIELYELCVTEYFPQGITKIGLIFQNGLNELNAKGTITRICLAYLLHLDEQRQVRTIRVEFPLAQYSASILNFFLQQRQAYAVGGELFGPDRPWDKEIREYGMIATPIYYAPLAGLQCTVEQLERKGADVNAQGGD
ncbi:nucleoside phosphorylase domain-containing protein [Aspergillus undulatus]|uniref:nucleoside phosphorylase domain-containing protein n=1 Tax=Aspergillus undulatus TaxID=1810928 RepID=UPI003CCDC94E